KQQQWGRRHPARLARNFHRLGSHAHRIRSEHLGKSLPDVEQSERDPHAPRAEAPQIEIISITNFPRYGVAKLGCLRIAVLEVHVVDQHQRNGEDQRAEEPETSSVSLPVYPAAKQSQQQEYPRERFLSSCMRTICVPQPLPPE